MKYFPDPEWKQRSPREEKWNVITHSIALGVMLPGMFIASGLPAKLLTGSHIITFLFSVLYHSSDMDYLRIRYRRLDMACIPLTIAAVGASYAMATDNSFWLVCYVPGLFGFAFVIFFYGTKLLEESMVPLCLVSGSLSAVVFLLGGYESNFVEPFIAGVAAYLVGLLFYIADRRKWFHTIWHIFVLTGSSIHAIILW